MEKEKNSISNTEKWYTAYYMEVYSFVMTILKNRDQAEELTQETFFKAMRGSYRGEAGELTWLCSIAKNLCMDLLRKQTKIQELDEEAADGTNIEQMIADTDSTLRIHQVLHNLEEPYKEVFSLRVFGELSFQNIGKVFGKTENWARVTYHRARLKIQERIQEM